MNRLTLSDLSAKVRDIDVVMLSTRTEGGPLAGRPMSNNRDVAHEGDSHCFTWEGSRTVGDITRDPKAGLSFVAGGLLGSPPLLVAVEGAVDVRRVIRGNAVNRATA